MGRDVFGGPEIEREAHRSAVTLAEPFGSAWLAALAQLQMGIVADEGRRALGDEHLDEVFATGLLLTQRDAVAEAHALCEAAASQSGA